MNYQPLFDHMSKEHGVTLLESEMQEIILIVDKMTKVQCENCIRHGTKADECWVCGEDFGEFKSKWT